MSKVVYIAHYDFPNGERSTSPAATTVIRYMINSLEKIKKQTVLVSPALSKKTLPREEIINGEHTKVVLLPTLKKPKKYDFPARLLRHLRQQKALENELLSQLEDGDTLLVYHSLSLINAVRKIFKKRKISLIIQVCEIYGDVINSTRTKKKELGFFKIADKYIFQSELIEELVNTQSKPYTILHGTYETTDDCRQENIANNDSKKIKCVYAGTLDTRKKGAEAALNAALYLSNKYHIHILGFGTEKEVQHIKERVEEISLKSECSVSYDGCLSGSEYVDFISSCDVGLSTQNPYASFNATSFPSKILAYMSHGLRVVTVRIPAIEKSAVSGDVFYYDENTPENIAKAISKIDFNKKYDSKETIRKLNCDFLKKLRELL